MGLSTLLQSFRRVKGRLFIFLAFLIIAATVAFCELWNAQYLALRIALFAFLVVFAMLAALAYSLREVTLKSEKERLTEDLRESRSEVALLKREVRRLARRLRSPPPPSGFLVACGRLWDALFRLLCWRFLKPSPVRS